MATARAVEEGDGGGKKEPVDFNFRKTQLILFDHSSNPDGINVEINLP